MPTRGFLSSHESKTQVSLVVLLRSEDSMSSVMRDLRFAAFQLWRHPAFTASVAITLAIGIGANTAIFTVVQSVLLAPLPYRNPDRLAFLSTHWADSGRNTPRMTGPDGVDLRDQAQTLEAVSLYSGGNEGVQLKDHGVYTAVSWVDPDFSRVFDLAPIAGRLFSDSESHRAALVGEHFAEDNFGSAQGAVGQVIHIETEAIEIVGVLPAGFDFPEKTEVWEAASARPESSSRTAFNYRAVALLRSGVNFDRAQTELSQIERRLQAAYPAENRNKEFLALPLKSAITGQARTTLLFLWAATAVLLLIACMNVSHLQLIRALERRRELAIRRALGSSLAQVLRPVLLEGLLLAVAGGIAGICVAWPLVHLLVSVAPRELPRAGEIHLSLPVLGFTIGISILAALLSSLLPAWRASQVDAAEALKQNIARGMNLKGASRWRNGLVVAEVAGTFVLAVGAGLLLRAMLDLMSRDLGYDTRQILVVDTDAPAHAEADYDRAVQQFYELFPKLQSLPGVRGAAGVMGLPMGDYGSNGYYEVLGNAPPAPDNRPWALFTVTSPNYFRTMEISLKTGRDFNARDSYQGPSVAIISESLARQSFGTGNPIGRQIRCGLDTPKWMTVVGVVSDVRQASPADQPGPVLYMPMAQHPYYANQIHVVLRTSVTPLSIMRPAEHIIRAAIPAAALRFTTMDRMVNDSVATQRFRADLIIGFAAVGLLLAMVGVYGTIAYTVRQRTFEIGVRMAFGAERAAILAGVLRGAGRLALLGVGIGLPVSILLARAASPMLAGVRPSDPISLITAACILLITALTAALIPGYRATQVEPMSALRVE
ncbi:ABC transporter permease [Acidobacteria bacterium AB60]|nr:ABC transporter permease [Acidobacteria bacterium AB60]